MIALDFFWSQDTDIHVPQKVVPHIEQPQESHSLGSPDVGTYCACF